MPGVELEAVAFGFKVELGDDGAGVGLGGAGGPLAGDDEFDAFDGDGIGVEMEQAAFALRALVDPVDRKVRLGFGGCAGKDADAIGEAEVSGGDDGGELVWIDEVVGLEEALGFFLSAFGVGGEAEGDGLATERDGVDDDFFSDVVEEEGLAEVTAVEVFGLRVGLEGDGIELR